MPSGSFARGAVRRSLIVYLLVGLLAYAPRAVVGQTPHTQPTASTNQSTDQSTEPPLRLADLEAMALAGNPTLAQAEAAVRAAEGRRVQAGLLPNPVIGYQGNEFAFRAFGDKSEHMGFIEQTLPLGGKLGKSRAVAARAKEQAETDTATQRGRILNAVRVLFYQALGAQELVAVRGQLVRLARDAVKTTAELFNVGQADRPDAAQIAIEAERAELDLLMAENARDQVWQQLAAVVGNPFLKPTRLAGELAKEVPQLDQAALLQDLLTNSPEVKRARLGVERARAAVTRARAEVAPDLYLRGAFGYNRELLEREIARNRRTGPEASVEVGVRIPLFNRNQGGVAAAGAELEIAEREVRRVELVLRARFAAIYRSYLNAQRIATQYREHIIPQAQTAYDLYRAGFSRMAASYPQVLITQRTLFQVRVEYVQALVNVWQNAVQLRGYLLSGALNAPGEAPPSSDAMNSEEQE